MTGPMKDVDPDQVENDTGVYWRTFYKLERNFQESQFPLAMAQKVYEKQLLCVCMEPPNSGHTWGPSLLSFVGRLSSFEGLFRVCIYKGTFRVLWRFTFPPPPPPPPPPPESVEKSY